MPTRLSGLCAAALIASSAGALAAGPCKTGTPTIVRVSTIKAGGTRAGFDKAAMDQAKWYKDHGITANEITEAEVVDMKSGSLVPSATEVMTLHYNPPALVGKQPAVDDAYKAFVAEFRANSDITVEKLVCLPDRK